MAMLALSASARLSHSRIAKQHRKSSGGGDTRLPILLASWTMSSRSSNGNRSSIAASALRHNHPGGDEQQGGDAGPSSSVSSPPDAAGVRTSRRNAERTTYLFAAIASSCGITTLAAAAVYYRFVWQMQGSGEVPASEMLGTFLLAFGAAVGMEFWARWAHKALWHASLWGMHKSHHRPREGPFELNDVFAIINAVPAIALICYGFFHKGLVPGLCFGAGLGITVFGIAYMFVHDGLVHRRFPVGPIADVPYFQKVAAAHQLHHADLFQGVPYGLFLGPKELEQVGGSSELERLVKARQKSRATSSSTSTTS